MSTLWRIGFICSVLQLRCMPGCKYITCKNWDARLLLQSPTSEHQETFTRSQLCLRCHKTKWFPFSVGAVAPWLSVRRSPWQAAEH